jgi:thiamine transport system ATP-binding protein
MLDVTGLVVRFGTRTVLDNVSLHVDAGEIVAILGPSGSGKSTLFRVIAGLLPADRGTVTIDGRDVTTTPPHRRGVGMVFQDDQLFPHLDVAANIAFSMRMRGASRTERQQRVDELLDLVGLPGLASRAVTNLSGGEAKRVALARSLATRPDVLLLDEPLTGLDRELHDRLAEDLRTVLRATGVTALLVTHDVAEAGVVADRSRMLHPVD